MNRRNYMQSDNKELKDVLNKYLRHWPWFLLSILLSVTCGILYLRYTLPVHSAQASIIVQNREGNNNSGPGMGYSDLGLLNGLGSGSMEKEIAILNSKRLMENVVRALNLNIQYFIEGKVHTIEIYKDLPFSFLVLQLNEERLRKRGPSIFRIMPIESNKGIKLVDVGTETVIHSENGNTFSVGFAEIAISPHEEFNLRNFPEGIVLRFSDVGQIAAQYLGRVTLHQPKESSPVIKVSINDEVSEKAKDILDQLIFEFNKDAIDDKNLIAGNTADFINDRLAIINKELDSVETGKEEFKEDNRLTDIQAESQMYIQNASEYNKRRQEVNTQLELANAMINYVSSNSEMELLPANLGIEEEGVNQRIGEFNDLVLERNRLLNSSTEKNPMVVRLNSQINQIRNNVVQSLQGMRSNLQILSSDLNRQSYSLGNQILAVPSQEREYRGIERQQKIKESLYLFMLQKREENSLALAVTSPRAKIVDRAYYAGVVSPNPKSIFLGTFLLGLAIPFSVIFAKDMLDNKVRRRNDVENLIGEERFLGELPRLSRKNEHIIKENDRSILAESFRILMANIQSILIKRRIGLKGVSLFVTSTVKGEGKTFAAMNLAITLAHTGKKVILIGADLRNPQLQRYESSKVISLGLSDYLMDDTIDFREHIMKSVNNSELDILLSGNIPENPSKIMKEEKMEFFFCELKRTYDYVVVDTAPSLLVADTFLMNKYADLTIYIARAGSTEKKFLQFAIDAKKEGNLKNLGFVLNDVKQSNLGYGKKYGYGYLPEKKSLWSRSRKNVAF